MENKENLNDKHELDCLLDKCREIVKTGDREGYLIGNLLNQSIYWPIKALNVECAGIKDRSSQIITSTAGIDAPVSVRFAFWHEIIDLIFDPSLKKMPFKHPVAEALFLSIRSFMVKKNDENFNVASVKRWLHSIVTSRETDFNVRQYLSMVDIERYGEASYSAQLYIMNAIAPHRYISPLSSQKHQLSRDTSDADHAASHLGKSQSISLLLKGILPSLVEKGSFYLPIDLCVKNGSFSQQDVINAFTSTTEQTSFLHWPNNQKPSEQEREVKNSLVQHISQVVFEMATAGMNHLTVVNSSPALLKATRSHRHLLLTSVFVPPITLSTTATKVIHVVADENQVKIHPIFDK